MISACLCIMARNESATILQALSSALPLISSVALLLDSSTTDDTEKIVKEFCGEKNLRLTVKVSDWKNFGVNRNECLELGRATGETWLVILDADDYLKVNVQEFSSFDECFDAFRILVVHDNLRYSKTQVIKAKKPFYFELPTHEALYCREHFSQTELSSVTMVIGKGFARKNDAEIFSRDARLLENFLRENPKNERAAFYLAQSYRDAGDLKKALEAYLLRAGMGGWCEEVYISLTEAAKCGERLFLAFGKVSQLYYNAYRYRPERGEAQYHLMRYMNLKVPQNPPKEDILFIEPSAYLTKGDQLI